MVVLSVVAGGVGCGSGWWWVQTEVGVECVGGGVCGRRELL